MRSFCFLLPIPCFRGSLHLARSCLSLALLVLGVLADHAYHACASYHLALHANLLYRCTNLHNFVALLCVQPTSAKSSFKLSAFNSQLFLRNRTSLLGPNKLTPDNRSLVPVHNPSAIQVIRTQLHRHAVPGQNPDEVLAHPAGHMRQSLVVVLSSFTLNIAFGNVSRTVAMTSIASSFDNRYPILPDYSSRPLHRVLTRHESTSVFSFSALRLFPSHHAVRIGAKKLKAWG